MSTRLTYHGAASYEIVSPTHTILIDPFLSDNPLAPCGPDDLRTPDVILVSHAAVDHYGDAPSIAKRTGAPVICDAAVRAKLIDDGVSPDQVTQTTWGIVVDIAGIVVRPVECHHWSMATLSDGRTVVGNPIAFIVETEPVDGAEVSPERRRRGAEQYLVGGHLPEGEKLLAPLFREQGLYYPSRPMVGLALMLWQLARLRWSWSRWVARPVETAPDDVRRRLDLLWSAARGLVAVDPLRGGYFLVRASTEALRAGASGFVVKHAAGTELIAAIHAALRGKSYLTAALAQDVAAILADRTPSRGRLTPRQRDVVRLIAEGRTVKEVAATLGLSPRTVETHKYQIMEALGLRTTAELIRYAIEHGLTTSPRPD